MSCDEADAILAGAALGGEEEERRLAGAEAQALACPSCASSRLRWLHLAGLLAAGVFPIVPPPRLRRRIMARVWAESVEGAAGPRHGDWLIR